MYFSLSCVWGVSDEILSKIFVLFTIYSDIMSVWVISKRVGEFRLQKHHEHHHENLMYQEICW